MKTKKRILSLCFWVCIISLNLSSFANSNTDFSPLPPPEKKITSGNTLNILQQSKIIKGNVKDQSGESIIGAMVVDANNKSNGTVTDIDGNFRLKVPNNAVVNISYMGFLTQQVNTVGKTNFIIILKDDVTSAEEVIVVGFGTQKKINVTGSVSTITAKAIESRPVINVTQALQGLVPGLNFSVGDNGGSLNNALTINVRGGGTINDGSSSAPLVLIDGVEGDMNNLNPNDIATISVLKDAASSSIYGSRAAFGVILITTKEGVAGKTSINYSTNVRFSNATSLPVKMDSYTFANYFNQAKLNESGTKIFDDETIEKILQYQQGELKTQTSWNPAGNGDWRYQGGGANANTDWYKEMYKNWVPSQEHNISVSGGNDNVTYLVSGNFLDQNGLLRHGDDELQRYSLNARINAKLNDYVRLTYGSRWTREVYDRPSSMSGTFFHDITRNWPNLPVLDGNGNYLSGNNIAQLIEGGRDKNEYDQTYNQFQLVIEPIKNWNIYTEGNIRTQNTFNHWSVLPVYGYGLEGEPIPFAWSGDYSPGASRVSETSNKNTFYTTNIYTDYFKSFDSGHYFKVMGGFNSELYNYRSVWGQKDNLVSPSVPTLDTATENAKTGGGYSHWSTTGFFGRLNYNYKEIYLLEANLRYDGTSRFIGDRRWGLFPSVSAGYNLAKEEFFTDSKISDYISTFKIRGSWGQLGNTNTKSFYPYFQNLPIQTSNGSWLINGEKPNTADAAGIVSSFLTWETVQSWNIGFDFVALNNRLSGSFDYFNRKTLNMVGPAPELSEALGTEVPKINNADLESFGFELELGWQDNIGDVNYGIKFLLSDDQQRVTRYPNKKGLISQYYAGKFFGDIWGYETIGIAKTQAEMDAHLKHTDQSALGTEWGAGDIMYKDMNGDGKVDAGAETLNNSGDRTIIGNNTSRYKFGLILNAAWKGIDIRLFFQGVGKRDYWLGDPSFWGATGADQWQAAAFDEHLDYFSPKNPNGYYPRPLFGKGDKNILPQTRYLQDASYIRLKNVQLGYTFPRKITQKAKIQMLRLYISADNVWTYSKLSSIFDPEALSGSYGNGKLYPLQTVIAVGLNINF